MRPLRLWRVLCAGVGVGIVLAQVAAAATLTRLVAVKGKVRIEGSSNIDTWQVESKAVSGFLEVGPEFPLNSGQKSSVGPMEGRGEVTVEVRSLKSVEKDGKPFSNKMDEIMYEALRAKQDPQITFRSSRLVLRRAGKVSSSPDEFDAHGQLVVGGAAKEMTVPVNLLLLANHQVKMWGSTTIKMTDFKIEPPSPTITLGLIKTDDEVKVSFEWVLAPR
jgi:polyisoprenoid-binding protein YceI